MPDAVFDGGNARCKWFNPRTNKYGDFRHALIQLEENQWKMISGRSSKPPEGFARINDVPFAFGDAARRYGIAERPKGASRYRSTYYGVLAAYAASEVFEKSQRNITLVASHAPADIQYSRHIIESVRGNWRVVSRHGEMDFQIKSVETFDEPLGGYCHFAFTEKGEEKKKNALAKVTTLVVDVGGYTVDVAAIDPGGEIDNLSLHSTRTGILELTRSFERELRSNFSTLFQDTGDIDVRKIENAILSGTFQFGKQSLDCKSIANEALNVLVNDVIQIIQAAGGIANFEIILLTGGGAALIHKKLADWMPHANFTLAEPQVALLKYANVFGGAKLMALLRLNGAI